MTTEQFKESVDVEILSNSIRSMLLVYTTSAQFPDEGIDRKEFAHHLTILFQFLDDLKLEMTKHGEK